MLKRVSTATVQKSSQTSLVSPGLRLDRRKEDAAGLLDYKLYWSGAVNDRSSSTEASYLEITVAAHRERILHLNYE